MLISASIVYGSNDVKFMDMLAYDHGKIKQRRRA